MNRLPFRVTILQNPKKVSIESSFRAEIGEECMEGSSIGGHNPIGEENLCAKEGGGKDFDTSRRKRMKQRKEPPTPVCERDDDDAVINNTSSNCESASVDRLVDKYNKNEFRPPSIKESEVFPNALRLAAFEEDEQRQDNMIPNANTHGEHVMQKKSKRKKKANTDADLDFCVTQEQDHNGATVCVDDTESLLKDGLVTSSSAGFSSKEEGLLTTKQGFDVFDFEGSETVNRQNENLIHIAATSNLEADNLDKLCSAAVKFVEVETMTTRKTGRKAVHPKRWITVLSERLTWNQSSKSSSKKKCANKKSRLSTKGTCPVEMPSDDDFNLEAHCMEEEENDGSSQVIVDDGSVACPAGCGRLYTKKTSAYYRHRQRCSG